jgi:hypothetical protein
MGQQRQLNSGWIQLHSGPDGLQRDIKPQGQRAEKRYGKENTRKSREFRTFLSLGIAPTPAPAHEVFKRLSLTSPPGRRVLDLNPDKLDM